MQELEKKTKRTHSRREFIKFAGLSAAGALLAACQPTEVVKTVEVEKIVEVEVPVEVEKEVEVPVEVEKIVEVEKVVEVEETWVMGTSPADTEGTFHIISWADESESRSNFVQVERFLEENYPNMTLEYEWGIPWGEYWTKFPTLVAGGAEVEMAWQHDSRAHVLPTLGIVLPLDEYLDAFPPDGWPDRFYPSQVESFKHEGKMYAFPWDWAPGGFYINVGMWEEAGLGGLPTEDWTWDDILVAAKELTRDTNGDGEIDQWGITRIPTSANASYWMLKSFGGDLWNEDLTESRMNEPESVEAYQFLADLMWEHGVMMSPDTLAGLGFTSEFSFASGLGCIHWSLNDTAFRMGEAVAGAFEWTVAPTPTGPAGRFQFTGGSAFCAPSTSRFPDISYELIRYCLSKPENLMMTGLMGSVFVGHMDFYQYGMPTADLGVDPEQFKHTFYDLGIRDASYPVYHAMYQEWEANAYTRCMDPLWIGEERDAAVVCQCADEATNDYLQQLQEM